MNFLDNWIKQLLPWLMSSGIRILIIVIISIIVYYILKKVLSRVVKIAVVPRNGDDYIGEVQREQTLTHF